MSENPTDIGHKKDSGKLRWDLVQPLILQEYVKVLTKGAEKYAPDNWRKVPDQRHRYFAALLRHVWAWWLGERNDPEWGLHQLAHAMCCLTFLAEPELETAPQKCQHPKHKWVPHHGWKCNECGETIPNSAACPHQWKLGFEGDTVCLHCGTKLYEKSVVESPHESNADSTRVREPDSPSSEGGGG